MEDRRIDIEVDGIQFISHGHYYDGMNNWLCHQLKDNDPQVIDYCARQLAYVARECDYSSHSRASWKRDQTLSLPEQLAQ